MARPELVFAVCALVCTRISVQQSQHSLFSLSLQYQSLLARVTALRQTLMNEIGELQTKMKNQGLVGGSHSPTRTTLEAHLRPTKIRANVVGTKVTYILDYTAGKEPRVIWRTNEEPVAISNQGITSRYFHNEKGTVRLETSTDREVVVSLIADHITFVIALNKNLRLSKEVPITVASLIVTPGPDLPYIRSRPVQITVSSAKASPGFNPIKDFQWNFWTANVSTTPPMMEEYPQWGQSSVGVVGADPLRVIDTQETQTDLTIKYEILTQKADYEGILIFSKFITPSNNDSLITGMTEVRYVMVRRSDHLDPFPRGFIGFVQKNPPMKACKLHRTCSIACHAVGNTPDQLILLKVQKDASRPQVHLQRLQVTEPYMLYTHFGFPSMTPADEGTYVCRANSGSNVMETSTKLVISEEVKIINSSSGVRNIQNRLTVTCSASGKPLPHITMFENYVYTKEITEGRYYHLDTIVDRSNGQSKMALTVTVLDLKPDLWRIMCMADNPFQLKVADFEIFRNQWHYG